MNSSQTIQSISNLWPPLMVRFFASARDKLPSTRGHILVLIAGLLTAVILGLITAVQPLLALLLMIALGSLGALAWLVRRVAPGAPLWIKASFLVVMGQLVFSYGFSNIIFFVGGIPLPLTECVLFVALCACAHRFWLARSRLALPLPLWLLVLWIAFNLTWHLPSGLIRDGVGAARDAMPTVEMLFIIPGFAISMICLQEGLRGQIWIRSVLLILVCLLAIYGLLYPLSASIQAISPRVTSLQQSVPIFGHFTSFPAVSLMAMIGWALWRWQSSEPTGFWGSVLGAVILIAGLLVFFMIQSRIAYLFVGISLIVFLVIGGQAKQASRITLALLVGTTLLLTIEMSGLEIKGRVGRLSASGVFEHVMTLTGQTSDSRSEFSGAAGGVNQRRQWRDFSLKLWSRDTSTQILGIGFGHVLTDLTTTGTEGQTMIVREPHNSYVTTLSRSGIVGLVVMLSLHSSVLWICLYGYRRHYLTHRPQAAYFLGVMFYELYSLLNSWGEPHFEVAHFAVPSYFIYGTVIGLHIYIAQTNQAPTKTVPTNAIGKPLCGIATPT
jgi:hypothetical protein